MNWKSLLLTNIPREGEGAGTGAGDAAAAAAAAAAAKPWYEGKADAELIGHWDNKGWKKDDPVNVAIEASKAARELQKHFGVPPEQLLKLPKDAADEKGWGEVYGRLGVPKEGKEYDFAGVKHADGSEVAPALLDAIRAAALAGRTPKDRATEFAKPIIKALDDLKAAEAADFTAKVAEEKKTLAKNWGTTPEKLDASHQMNLARLGAQRLGITPEAVAALEKQTGYASVMESMRKIGAGSSEDTYVDGKGGDGAAPMTRDGAVSRLKELEGDPDWRKRLLDGGVPERREFDALTQMIAA